MEVTSDAERKVFEIVRKHFKKAAVLEAGTRFRDDLGADSLDLVELVYEFEQEFGVTIPDTEAVTFRTLGDAVRYVEKAVA